MKQTLFVAMAALTGQLFAGGFFLQLGNPEANPEAQKAHAVLVVKATGCHDPATAQLTATAVGTVNGKRQSIPLVVTKLSEAGSFAIAQQWPKDSKWVLELVGRNGEQFTNTLVSAGPNGIDRLHAKSAMKEFAKSDLESLLD
jgi:hypothetical protein